MYKSPIEIVEDIQEKVTMSMENNVVRAVQAVGINIDKHELIAALMQDKMRYEAAYEQGKRDAVKHGRWEEVTNKWAALEIRCSECGAEVPRDGWGNALRAHYCPNCGAKMSTSNNAHWIKQPNGEYKCSVCGDTTLVPLYECYTCGAYMQEGEE